MTIRKWHSGAVVLCLLLGAGRAEAQQAEDQAAARSLFDEARKLAKAGQYADACPKFEAAARLYSSAGILLNLGDCYEKIGRTASAWTEFGESAAAADRANRRDQAREARRRQAALQPKLSRITIVVPHEVVGLVITQDQTDLTEAAWGSPIPVDLGAHAIRAHAPGHDDWETTVDVSSPGQTVSVEVPELKSTPVAAAPPPAATGSSSAGYPTSLPPPVAETEPEKPRSRVAGIVVAGVGAAIGIGGGVLMGVEANRAASARASDTTAATSQTSINQYDSTKTPYYLGVAALAAGGVVAISGVVLIVAGHGKRPPQTGILATHATPWIDARSGGLSVQGNW
jgi:hypothetical protein